MASTAAYFDQSLSSPLAAMMAAPGGFSFAFDEPLVFGETSSESSHTSSPPPAVPPDSPDASHTALIQSTDEESVGATDRRRKTAKTPKALALKRARRSEIERKSRLRRLDELSRMRDQLMRLEWEYKRLTDDEELQELVFDTEKTQSVQIVASKIHSDKTRIHRRLTFMTQLLSEEQSQLRKMLHEHEIFQETMRSVWRCDLSEDAQRSSADAGYTMPPPESSREWVHPSRCFAFLRETYELISTFDASHDFESSGHSIMGWTDKRRVDDATGHLQYGFRKTFLGQHAETLLTKSWDVLRDASKMWKLLVDPNVTTAYTTLQVFNDDLTLIRRDHTHPPLPFTFLTAHVLFRLQTPQGYLLCFRTMPMPEIQDALQPHEIWFDILNWTMFNHVYDADGRIAGCEVVTGGSLSDPSQVTTKHWLFELIISVLRWESVCVAPLFLMGESA